jgi:hypothetical protein
MSLALALLIPPTYDYFKLGALGEPIITLDRIYLPVYVEDAGGHDPAREGDRLGLQHGIAGRLLP